MAIQHPDIQPAVNHSVQVAIAGAGPVGLMMANYLGQMGIDVLVVEKLDKLIDYPRAIGIDDEALRTMQSVGLVDDVLPHTTPWHAMRFLTPKGRCFADIQPMTDEFGWPRRNAFIQPQVDAVMLEGVSRFPNVRCLFSRELEVFSQQDDEVTLHLKTAEGQREIVKAQWLVACDGGASFVRRTLNVPFEGKTAPNQWIVVDIANDPLSTPHIYLCCDPVRPYVSAALPHAVRRFEFMVMPGETEEQLREPQNMRKLLSKVLPNPDNVELIRQRVYTHNARLAQRFRIDRVLLAGDAAHIMPVWQGQGYNSGMRDAFNLAWKLALVIQGKARDALLDTYQQERRDHAKAMIDLSVTAGNVLAPPKRWQGTLRDGVSWLLNYLPPVKRYFLEMRFKPMPQYYGGALMREGEAKHSPVGKMFIQPKVTLEELDKLEARLQEADSMAGYGSLGVQGLTYQLLDVMYPLIDQARMLVQKYDVVVTNPPYMGGSGMNARLSDYVKKYYPDSKSDLFAVFIERCAQMDKRGGYQAMITQHAWMFLSSFEKLRAKLQLIDTVNMAHLGARGFDEIGGEVVQTTSFVMRNSHIKGYKGTYCRLIDGNGEKAKAEQFVSGENRYVIEQSDFSKISGEPIAYWASETLRSILASETKLKDLGRVTLGMRTGDNTRFLRLWHEISTDKFCYNADSAESAQSSGAKWFPYNKGGEFRKWYGNTESVVNWENDGYEIKENTRRTYPQLGDNLGWKITSEDRYFTRGIAWSRISSTNFGVRICESNLIFDTNAPMFFPDEGDWLDYIAGYMCTKISSKILSILNPTLTFQVVDVGNLPVILDKHHKFDVEENVKKAFTLSKSDWDSFETSWDFKRHPLI